MTAKQRIENLTNAWYGYAVFATLATIVGNIWYGLFSWGFWFGFGMLAVAFSIGISVVGLAISIAITAFLGRKLLARSSFTRALLVVLSAVFAVLCAISTFSEAWQFLHYWSIAGIIRIALPAAAALLQVRSFSVLNDPEVRAYCR